MSCRAYRGPSLTLSPWPQADLRDLRHRFAFNSRQQVFLLGAIDAKLIEIDRLEHPDVGETLARIVGGAERGPW